LRGPEARGGRELQKRRGIQAAARVVLQGSARALRSWVVRGAASAQVLQRGRLGLAALPPQP
jgi:hypothetical protein